MILAKSSLTARPALKHQNIVVGAACPLSTTVLFLEDTVLESTRPSPTIPSTAQALSLLKAAPLLPLLLRLVPLRLPVHLGPLVRLENLLPLLLEQTSFTLVSLLTRLVWRTNTENPWQFARLNV